MKLLWAMLLMAGAAQADSAKLDGAAITALLAGHEVTYADDSKQSFASDGGTVYTKDRPSTGQWQVRGDQYCSVWPPSDHWACYDVTQDAEVVGFVAGDGSVSFGKIAP
jgi:hypothetical protein